MGGIPPVGWPNGTYFEARHKNDDKRTNRGSAILLAAEGTVSEPFAVDGGQASVALVRSGPGREANFVDETPQTPW
jgi:hypothetical protein